MTVFNPDEFAKKVTSDLALLRIDMEIFRALPAEERKKVLKKVLNKLIDIPAMPDFLEPLLFRFMVEYMEYFFKTNFQKEE